MKGLLKNNFYAAESNLKATVLTSIIAITIITVGSFLYPFNGNTVVSIIISGLLGAFGALSGTAIQKDVNCKWNKFELTMPVSRKDVVGARYLSFLIYILIGICLTIISVLLIFVVSGSINLERVGYSFTFGMAFALSIPTFLYPLVLIFGIEKNEILLVVSVILGMALFFVSCVLANPFLKSFGNPNLLFRLSYIIVSIGLFALSYIFSLWYYRKKEL